MNKKDFWKAYSQKYGISQEKAKHICTSVTNLLAECIRKEDRVQISGLGIFKKKKVKAHNGWDVRHQKAIVIPEKEKLMFVLLQREDSNLLGGEDVASPAECKNINMQN